MRLIADGYVDRVGVAGLADRLGLSRRHLQRILVDELGAGPLALARARRAQNARTLIDVTDLSMADVAFAAGFSSVRQFNDTVREVYAATPSQLRGRRTRRSPGVGGRVEVRLPVRTPFAGTALLDFLAVRAVPGVEVVRDGRYARTLRLPHGPGIVELQVPDVRIAGERAHATATFALSDLRDLGPATERARRLIDADCDPVAVDAVLGADPVFAADVAAVPGLRVPGQVDGFEVLVRAVLGQQVTVVGARTLATRLVERYGEPVVTDVPGLDRLFPSPDCLAVTDVAAWAMPRARVRALQEVAGLLASGELVLDRGEDRAEVRRRLVAVKGIGTWTADYVAMRALGRRTASCPGTRGPATPFDGSDMTRPRRQWWLNDGARGVRTRR